MTLPLVLLLTPVFSRYDILESAVISIYLQKALPPGSTVASLVTHTPYLLYQQYGLYNPGRQLIDPSSPETLVAQQIIMLLAMSASVLNLLANASLVFVVGNGPVVNEGFSSLLGVASTLGKPIVYWKDDVRHLWGFQDNPWSIGMLPTISNHMMEPSTFPIRLNYYDSTKPNNCGGMTFPDLIADALKNNARITAGAPSSHMQQLISLGQILNLSFGSTYANIPKDPKAAYNLIKTVLRQNPGYVADADIQYLATQGFPIGDAAVVKANIRPSPPIPVPYVEGQFAATKNTISAQGSLAVKAMELLKTINPTNDAEMVSTLWG